MYVLSTKHIEPIKKRSLVCTISKDSLGIEQIPGSKALESKGVIKNVPMCIRSLVNYSMKCLIMKSQKEQISRDRVMDSAKDLCRIINQSIDSNEISGWVFDQN